MWKVLLVEDEPLARKSLRHIIDWEARGFTVIGEAEHGAKALRMAYESKPDLIISDIMMPEMDGIELLTRVRKEGLDIEFIMLTCFSEFEYARYSLELGALQYILKGSMKASTLEESLKKAAKVLAHKEEQLRTEHRLQLHEHRLQYEKIWGHFHSYFETEQEREKDLQDIRISDFTSGIERHLSMYMTWQERGSSSSSWLHDLLYAQEERGELHSFIRSDILTVFYWSNHPFHIKSDAWSRNRPVVLQRSHTMGRSVIETWGHMLREWDHNWYGEAGLSTAELSGQSPGVSLEWNQEREFVRCIEMSKIDGAVSLLQEIWAQMRSRRLPVAMVMETAKRLDLIMSRITSQPSGISTAMPPAHTHNFLLENMILRTQQYHQQWRQDQVKLTDHSEINLILKYIRDHYSQDISLKGLAQYVSMDEHYISALFKKKMGETLIHYVQQTRIEQAKFYLRETNLPVSEISARVGFANENYFFKLFKRWTNSTPNDFRNQ